MAVRVSVLTAPAGLRVHPLNNESNAYFSTESLIVDGSPGACRAHGASAALG
eukprot:SAG11_NODE_38255_length_253_cov_0.668831_1_plen_51_part_10